jgi:hypothetical protein
LKETTAAFICSSAEPHHLAAAMAPPPAETFDAAPFATLYTIKPLVKMGKQKTVWRTSVS